jgi:hypothetical protein
VATRALIPVLCVAVLLLASCGGGHTPAAVKKPSQAAGTVWLCLPGRAPDPCATSLATTVVRADGTKTVERPRIATHPGIDCFYVYPTISQENRGNADLQIQLPQILVAQAQASRFSQVCSVYAPVYRQITNRGLTTPSLHARPLLAYDDVAAAWRDYLSNHNHGRGVVLIGHSQGAYILKHLLRTVIDRSPAERHLLVSAILLGGQVLAANGPEDRGDFVHVPPCASSTATGCVVAYSSFDRVPPANARFGRDRSASTHVLCVNPASPGARNATQVTPLLPSSILSFLGGGGTVQASTPWVSMPGLYTARCERSGTASWLQISRTHVPGDRRPVVRPVFGAGWGLHATDVNIALANLVELVQAQSRAYLTHH